MCIEEQELMLLGHVIGVLSSHLMQQPSLQRLRFHCHLYGQACKTYDTMARKQDIMQTCCNWYMRVLGQRVS